MAPITPEIRSKNGNLGTNCEGSNAANARDTRRLNRFYAGIQLAVVQRALAGMQPSRIQSARRDSLTGAIFKMAPPRPALGPCHEGVFVVFLAAKLHWEINEFSHHGPIGR